MGPFLLTQIHGFPARGLFHFDAESESVDGSGAVHYHGAAPVPFLVCSTHLNGGPGVNALLASDTQGLGCDIDGVCKDGTGVTLGLNV